MKYTLDAFVDMNGYLETEQQDTSDEFLELVEEKQCRDMV